MTGIWEYTKDISPVNRFIFPVPKPVSYNRNSFPEELLFIPTREKLFEYYSKYKARTKPSPNDTESNNNDHSAIKNKFKKRYRYQRQRSKTNFDAFFATLRETKEQKRKKDEVKENEKNAIYCDDEAIPCLYIKRKYKLAQPTHLLLYCHGNAEDLGKCYPILEYLSMKLPVNIIAPEYPGYGIAPGYASENTVSQTIQSIYEFIVSPYGLNFPTNRLIIYGFSIGSGAAISVSQADLNKIYFRKKFIKSYFARKYDNSRDSKDSKNKHNHHNQNHNHNHNNQNHKENSEKENHRDTKTLYNTSNAETNTNTNVNTMPLLSAANVHRKMNDQSFSRSPSHSHSGSLSNMSASVIDEKTWLPASLMKFIDPCLPHKRSSADDTENSNSADIEPTQETLDLAIAYAVDAREYTRQNNNNIDNNSNDNNGNNNTNENNGLTMINFINGDNHVNANTNTNVNTNANNNESRNADVNSKNGKNSDRESKEKKNEDKRKRKEEKRNASLRLWQKQVNLKMASKLRKIRRLSRELMEYRMPCPYYGTGNNIMNSHSKSIPPHAFLLSDENGFEEKKTEATYFNQDIIHSNNNNNNSNNNHNNHNNNHNHSMRNNSNNNSHLHTTSFNNTNNYNHGNKNGNSLDNINGDDSLFELGDNRSLSELAEPDLDYYGPFIMNMKQKRTRLQRRFSRRSNVNFDDFNKVEIMDIVYYKEIKGSAIDSNHYSKKVSNSMKELNYFYSTFLDKCPESGDCYVPMNGECDTIDDYFYNLRKDILNDLKINIEEKIDDDLQKQKEKARLLREQQLQRQQAALQAVQQQQKQQQEMQRNGIQSQSAANLNGNRDSRKSLPTSQVTRAATMHHPNNHNHNHPGHYSNHHHHHSHSSHDISRMGINQDSLAGGGLHTVRGSPSPNYVYSPHSQSHTRKTSLSKLPNHRIKDKNRFSKMNDMDDPFENLPVQHIMAMLNKANIQYNKQATKSQLIMIGRKAGLIPPLHSCQSANIQRKYGLMTIVCPFVSIAQVVSDKVGSFASMLLSDRFSNLDKIKSGKLHGPLLIIHGKEDTIIPCTHSIELFRAATDMDNGARFINKCQLKLLPNCDHNTMDLRKISTEMYKFFEWDFKFARNANREYHKFLRGKIKKYLEIQRLQQDVWKYYYRKQQKYQRKLQKREVLSMIKHASEDIGDENKQHDENNEMNKNKNGNSNKHNSDNNGNEADLNSVTSQGSGDNNFQFNFSDLRAGKHKMSVYDVFGDDNKPHSHNKKRHSHRKRSSTNKNRMTRTCHKKYCRKHYPTNVNKLNETEDGGGIRLSQEKLDELDNMQSSTGGKGDGVDDTTSKRVRRRSNPRNIDGKRGGKDEASDSDDYNRHSDSPSYVEGRGGSHSSEEDRLGIEPRQSDGNKSKNELSVNINDIDLMASFGEEICSTCSDNMSDNNNDDSDSSSSFTTTSSSSASTIIANNDTDTDDSDIDDGIFIKIPYYCWLKPRPPLPGQEPENDNGGAVDAMVRGLQQLYGNGANTANNSNNNNNNKANNDAKRRRNTTTSSAGSSHTSRPNPASMIQRNNSTGNNSSSNNGNTNSNNNNNNNNGNNSNNNSANNSASSLSQKSREPPKMSGDMLTATEFFREINRKFENGRTASFSGSNGNGNGNGNGSGSGNGSGNKGNNGRIGGVRSYSLVDHTSTTVTNLKAPNYAILQPGNNTSTSGRNGTKTNIAPNSHLGTRNNGQTRTHTGHQQRTYISGRKDTATMSTFEAFMSLFETDTNDSNGVSQQRKQKANNYLELSLQEEQLEQQKQQQKLKQKQKQKQRQQQQGRMNRNRSETGNGNVNSNSSLMSKVTIVRHTNNNNNSNNNNNGKNVKNVRLQSSSMTNVERSKELRYNNRMREEISRDPKIMSRYTEFKHQEKVAKGNKKLQSFFLGDLNTNSNSNTHSDLEYRIRQSNSRRPVRKKSGKSMQSNVENSINSSNSNSDDDNNNETRNGNNNNNSKPMDDTDSEDEAEYAEELLKSLEHVMITSKSNDDENVNSSNNNNNSSGKSTTNNNGSRGSNVSSLAPRSPSDHASQDSSISVESELLDLAMAVTDPQS